MLKFDMFAAKMPLMLTVDKQRLKRKQPAKAIAEVAKPM